MTAKGRMPLSSRFVGGLKNFTWLLDEPSVAPEPEASLKTMKLFAPRTRLLNVRLVATEALPWLFDMTEEVNRVLVVKVPTISFTAVVELPMNSMAPPARVTVAAFRRR